MNPDYPSGLQSSGFQTSVDIAQKQASSTSTSLAGAKRSRSENDTLQSFTTARNIFKTQNDDRIRNNNNSNNNRSRHAYRTFTSTDKRQLFPSRITSFSNDGGKPKPAPVRELSEYSQRTECPSTPEPSQNPTLSLSHPKYGLPSRLVANFASLGVNCIYPWQASCLLGRGHLEGEKNLVYSAPTGGGKSLVADVLMLKRVIEEPTKKAILVLPYVALVQEKMKWLRRVVEGVTKRENDNDSGNINSQSSPFATAPQNSIRVTGFFGGSKSRNTWSDTDIAVCTIEKVFLFHLHICLLRSSRTGCFNSDHHYLG